MDKTIKPVSRDMMLCKSIVEIVESCAVGHPRSTRLNVNQTQTQLAVRHSDVLAVRAGESSGMNRLMTGREACECL